MDDGEIDVLSTSQGRHAADGSLGFTYRTIYGCPEEVRTLFRDALRMSPGRNFSEWLGTGALKGHLRT